MSEPAVETPAGTTAGALLRNARERQGLHIAALAATIKITVNKLDALENDRYDELPDNTFTRALALTVCRALKIDAAPVLQMLPQGGATGLSRAKGGLNTPLRERSSGRTSSEPADGALTRRPLLWAALLVMVAAALVYLLPTAWWQSMLPESQSPEQGSMSAPPVTVVAQPAAATVVDTPVAPVAPEQTASAAGAAGAFEEPTVVVMHSMPSAAEASAADEGPAGVAVLRVSDASWVEVIDAKSQTLVSRTVQPGETVGLDGALPLKVKIGNAQGTELVFRSQPVNLTPFTRDNVARLELK